MPNIGTTELGTLWGSLPHCEIPIAASMSGSDRIRPGMLVKINGSGLIENVLQASQTWDTDEPAFGWADFDSAPNGTALAAGTFVKVIPFAANVIWYLSTVATTPVLADHLADSANTAGFVVKSSAAGLLQFDPGVTTKGVVRPFSPMRGDWATAFGRGVKSTGVIGDRFAVVVLNAAKQVIF